MWVNNLSRRSGMNTMSLLKKTMLGNSMIYGNLSMATFAKYDRTKPHLNVGTIGK